MRKSSILLWISIVICLCSVSFPGIFFINRIYPILFGLPFLYAFPLIVWGILCILTYIGYRTGWKLWKGEGKDILAKPVNKMRK